MRGEERRGEERELCQCVNAAIIIIWNLNNQTAPLHYTTTTTTAA
jgi:hypothetical protein